METIRTVLLDEDIAGIRVGISSVIGKRKEQQDTVKADDDYAIADCGKFIAVLCDGMGGLSGGKQASEMCASLILDTFHSADCPKDIHEFYRMVIAESDRRVIGIRDENGNPLKAGSTLISIVIKDKELYWASVGDSHIYLIRNNQIQCITNDHNYAMLLKEKVKRGEISQQEADSDPQKEALVSYIGMGGVKYMDINATPFKLMSGDYIVLCSDGLYRTVSEEDIKNIVYGIGDARDIANCLTEYAMRAAKRNQDNTSAIVIQYKN